MANNSHNWKNPLALVFMVQICQISLITLSVLSSYLFLYTCIEYHVCLCQNIRRGRGDNEFPMEIFFLFFTYKKRSHELVFFPKQDVSFCVRNLNAEGRLLVVVCAPE